MAPLPRELTIPSTASTAPLRARSSSQLRAMMWKNALLKRRAWKTTLAEFFSPPAFLAVLVLGYSLSSTTYIDASIYATSTLDIDTLLGVAQGFGSFGSSSSGADPPSVANATLYPPPPPPAAGLEGMPSPPPSPVNVGFLGGSSDTASDDDDDSELDLFSARTAITSIING